MLPILALAIESDEIWEAEPLHPDSTLVFWGINSHSQSGWLRVRLTQIYRSRLFQAGDTVWVGIGTAYSWPKQDFYSSRGSILDRDDTISRLLLFCRGWSAEQYREYYGHLPEHGRSVFADLNLSGIRLLDRRQRVYAPFQKENPGGYDFFRSSDRRWSEYLAETQHAIRRVDTLLAIRAIENPVEQNNALFAWIEAHADEIREEHFANNWYWYRDLAFVWILCNGVTEQAWEVLELHHSFFPTEMLSRWEWPSLGEPAAHPFRDAGSLFFLLEKIRQRDLAPGLQRAALWNFGDACHHTELPDSTRATLFRDITDVYPRMEAVMRETLVRAAASLAFRHEKPPVADALSFFIKARQEEPPGALRNTLSEIIVRQCSATEWEALSGNEGSLLVALNNFYYDSLKQRVSFSFYQEFGREHLYEQPMLEWYQTDAQGSPINRRALPLPVTYPEVDWSAGTLRWSGAASVALFVGDAPHGVWYFQAYGTAGRERQFRWASEPTVFTF